MRFLYHPDATACLIRQGKPLHILTSDILDKIPDDGEWNEAEVSYHEVEHVDGDFATLWTPYQYFDHGKAISLLVVLQLFINAIKRLTSVYWLLYKIRTARVSI